MPHEITVRSPCCGCASHPSRRALLEGLAGAALLVGTGLQAARADDDAPRAGDWLVPPDEPNAAPIKADDLKAGEKQVIAYPYDPKAQRARDGSRLNRIALIRLDPGRMDEATRARAADGVLGYSAICTHQGCEVNAWRAKEQTFLCFCHFSQFQPLQGAAVAAGPAPRPLPALALKTEQGRLVIASGFDAPPGTAG